MKVISVIQPWAMLIALGEKKFETRSWSTKYRGELAIHASKRVDKEACRQEPIHSVLANHGYKETNLPIGAILATCRLSDCLEVTKNEGDSAQLGFGTYNISGNEYMFGNYQEGRYAWELVDINLLDVYIPAKGQLGLWTYHEEAPLG
jgi:hypothetical protein